MNRKVRYGIVGLGGISQNSMLPAFEKETSSSQLVALFSSSRQKLDTLGTRYGATILESLENYEQVLKSGELDAVYIATPNSEHCKYALLALNNNVHVLCEKPLAPTVTECEQMIVAANKNSVLLMTAYRLHFEPMFNEIRTKLRSGTIGKLRYISSSFSYQIGNENSRLHASLAGGALSDIGIYCINAARYFFEEEPMAVVGKLITGEDQRFTEVEGSCFATLYFSNDKAATIYASFNGIRNSSIEIRGDAGVIRCDPALAGNELSCSLHANGTVTHQKYIVGDQFAAQLAHFSKCILSGTKVGPDGAEGLADMKVIEAITKASRTGEIVAVS